MDKRFSDISAHSGLNLDYFDPPLLDYMQLFEGDDGQQDDEIIDRDTSIPLFDASPQ